MERVVWKRGARGDGELLTRSRWRKEDGREARRLQDDDDGDDELGATASLGDPLDDLLLSLMHIVHFADIHLLCSKVDGRGKRLSVGRFGMCWRDRRDVTDSSDLVDTLPRNNIDSQPRRCPLLQIRTRRIWYFARNVDRDRS